ncbi:MAG TPA: vitamin K epoxide reductase family protein [Gemmatimonadales bacterium]|nr:vitamin K epoxide reductase family protein [Gemmatimonadales bacterium]
MRYRQAIALLALVGLFVALYLWLHALGFGGAIKCGASGGCETVQTSPWAVFLGLPVAFYGVVGYLAILIVALMALRPAALTQKNWSVTLLGLATVGVLFTGYLTYLELFVIHAICRWCVGSAVIITAIWVVAVMAMRRKEGMTER